MPSKFCRTAKLHKLSTKNVDDLPLCPIVSDIGTQHVRLQNIYQNYCCHLVPPKNRSGKKFLLDMKWFSRWIKPLGLFSKDFTRREK